MDWYYDKNNENNPTLNEIREGIKKQQYVQLLKTSNLDPSSESFKVAYEGKCKAWDAIFDEITDTNHDEVLTDSILLNPDHSVSKLLLFLYTTDSWIPYEVNSGSKEGDVAKVDTLGPYARAFARIIDAAGK